MDLDKPELFPCSVDRAGRNTGQFSNVCNSKPFGEPPDEESEEVLVPYAFVPLKATSSTLLASPSLASSSWHESVLDHHTGECLMVCVWVPNPRKEMDQNDNYGTTRSG